jgi:hypothetical protein
VFAVRWELKFYLLFKNLNLPIVQISCINYQICLSIRNKARDYDIGGSCARMGRR